MTFILYIFINLLMLCFLCSMGTRPLHFLPRTRTENETETWGREFAVS